MINFKAHGALKESNIKMNDNGKSKAQNNFAAKLEEFYPMSTVRQEVYIGDVIASKGYSIKEISKELGHPVHKMFVDIIISDAEIECAFEYNGAQHYKTVGNMTRTTADVIWNQELDEEKAWVLKRVGLPLAIVPFDAYVDSDIIDRWVSDAYAETESAQKELYICDRCGRRFPESVLLKSGHCRKCQDSIDREISESVSEKYKEQTDYSAYNKTEEERKAAFKAEQKAKRKAQREAYKASPEYQKQKEEARARRKEEYRKMKAERARLKSNS